MTNVHGDFIWYELLTTDADAAADFYGAVIGWRSEGSGQADVDYRFFFAAGSTDKTGGVGGYMAITPDMAAGGAVPVWLGYIAVDDVDSSAAKIAAAGGTVLMEPQDIPDVGRFAMVTDPQGVPFYVMRGFSDETSYSFASDKPRNGHCAWNELATTDPVAALDFYTAQFGWRQDGDLDMGLMGKYQFLHHGTGSIGAVMPKMPVMPAPTWTYYFRVPDIDAAVTAISANGGLVMQGPVEIPGGEYSATASDPVGASFGLVGPRISPEK
jgi:uncharacterized protein